MNKMLKRLKQYFFLTIRSKSLLTYFMLVLLVSISPIFLGKDCYNFLLSVLAGFISGLYATLVFNIDKRRHDDINEKENRAEKEAEEMIDNEDVLIELKKTKALLYILRSNINDYNITIKVIDCLYEVYRKIRAKDIAYDLLELISKFEQVLYNKKQINEDFIIDANKTIQMLQEQAILDNSNIERSVNKFHERIKKDYDWIVGK